MAAKLIYKNLFPQVDQEGRRHNLISMIIDVRKTDKSLKAEDAFNIYSNGTEQWKATTQGWEVCIQCKDGITTWNVV